MDTSLFNRPPGLLARRRQALRGRLSPSVDIRASRPNAVFPLRVATDADLLLGQNRIVTSLVSGINSTDGTITVVDPTGIAPNQVLSLGQDGEIVKVLGGGMGQSFTVERGYDGTEAISHPAGSAVLGNIVALHHNALSAEIQAIERTLGPNLSNISGTGGVLVTSEYNFEPRSANINLSVGNNQIPMDPMPPGIVSGYYLCIRDISGTMEAVPVVSVGPNVIVVTCAVAHPAGWTISSATSGIQEAINALPGNRGTVFIPDGDWPCCYGILINKNSINIRGSGRFAANLVANFSASSLITIDGAQQISIMDISLSGVSSTIAQWGIKVNIASDVDIERVYITGIYNGFSLTGACANVFLRTVSVTGVKGDGIYINAPFQGGNYYDIFISGDQVTPGSKAFHLTQCGGTNFVNVYSNYCANGMWVDPPTGQTASIVFGFNVDLDGYGTNSATGYGIAFVSQGGNVTMWQLVTGGVSGFGFGIVQVGGGRIEDVAFTNCIITNNKINGVSLGTEQSQILQNIFFTDCTLSGNSPDAIGANPALLIQNAANVMIKGGVYAASSFVNGWNSQSYGIIIGGNTHNCQVTNAVLMPNVSGPIYVGGSNPGLVIKDCVGYNPVGPSPIQVGPSPFTYTSGYSPETVYFYGGVISTVQLGPYTIIDTASTGQSPLTVPLYPQTTITINYTSPPYMLRDIQ